MYTLVVTAPADCSFSTLALAGSIFQTAPTSSLTYTVSATRTTLAWTDAEVIETKTDPSNVCGAYVWNLQYQGVDLTTDSTQTFSLDATGALSIYTTDSTKAGTHTLTVTVYLEDYPVVTLTKDFIVTITVVDTTFTAAYIPDITYVIGADLDLVKFEEFTFTTSGGNTADYTITYTAT